MIGRDFIPPGRSPAIGESGMVATSHPAASLAGLDILRAGGNAVDAAVAAAAVQAVLDPLMTGIGGDLFALYAPEGREPVAINGSGFAPKGATAEYFRSRGMKAIPDMSPHAVTVPGAVEAWCRLIERFGTMELDRVLAPAIAFAEGGFRITPRVGRDWAQYRARAGNTAACASQFLPNGEVPTIGERRDNPALGRTLRRVAREGRRAFYESEVAAEIVGLLRALGGLHAEEDFSDYFAFETAPISAEYRGYDLLECPPNGQGLAALLIARILSGFDLSEGALGEADRVHLFAEATKIAYTYRNRLIADADHLSFDVQDLLSESSVAPMRSSIRMDQASASPYWRMPAHRDTVYISVVDKDRNACSLINSLFSAFGSGIYAPESGVLLHNRGSGFVVEEGHPNCVGPRKRPLHTIIPALLQKDGGIAMAFGVMGGQYQAVGHAHFLSAMLDRGFDPQLANEAPRSFVYGGTLTLEPTFGDDVRADLEARGHMTAWSADPIGGCQAIWIDRERGVLIGASDHRKDGIALGY